MIFRPLQQPASSWLISLCFITMGLRAEPPAPDACFNLTQTLDELSRAPATMETFRLQRWLSSPAAIEIASYQGKDQLGAAGTAESSRVSGSREQEIALSLSLHNPLNQPALSEFEQLNQQLLQQQQRYQRWQTAGMLLQLSYQLKRTQVLLTQLSQMVNHHQALAESLQRAQQQGEAVRLDVLVVQQQLEELRLDQQQVAQEHSKHQQALAMIVPHRMNQPSVCAGPLPEFKHSPVWTAHPAWQIKAREQDLLQWQSQQQGQWQAQPWQLSISVRQQQANALTPVDHQVGLRLRIPLGGNANSLEQMQWQQQQQSMALATELLEKQFTLEWQQARLELARYQLQADTLDSQRQRLALSQQILQQALTAKELSVPDFIRLSYPLNLQQKLLSTVEVDLDYAKQRLAHTEGYSW